MIDKVIFDMIQYYAGDTRRINHAMKVYTTAKAIGCDIQEEDSSTILELSAILHDIGIHMCQRLHDSTSGKLQEQYSPIVAKKILEQYYDEGIVDMVCHIISKHHTYTDIKYIEHQILLEADLIVNYLEGDFTRRAFDNAVAMLFVTDRGIALQNEWIQVKGV